MEGSGVNTYMLINKTGKAPYVKFHLKPTCGVKCLLEDEAIKVGGSNHSLATQDLYDTIAAGNYPKWKLFVQTIDPDNEDKFDFDPLDVTRTWPKGILPLRPIGRLVLNKNINNFFVENERLACCPAVVVLVSTIQMISCCKLGSSPTQIPKGTNWGQTIFNS